MAANGVLNEVWTTSRARLGMRGSIEVRFPDFRSVTSTFSSSLLKVPSFSDASDSACTLCRVSRVRLWTGLLVCLFVCCGFFHQNLFPEEKEQSSTCREPKAVCFALEAFAGRLSNARVISYSDNQNVESALLNDSRKLDLQALASEH